MKLFRRWLCRWGFHTEKDGRTGRYEGERPFECRHCGEKYYGYETHGYG